MIRLSPKQLISMLTLQEILNERVTPDWRTANHPWHRAAWLECAELSDHIGWKWWKDQPMDEAQARMEVVDIWHFALSYALQSEGKDIMLVANRIRDDEALARGPLERGWAIRAGTVGEKEALLQLVGEMVMMCLDGGTVSPAMTLELADRVALSADQLYQAYVAKNVLNIFRQDHGYKEGTYIKTWEGFEDNQVVSQVLSDNPSITPPALLEVLESLYARATA